MPNMLTDSDGDTFTPVDSVGESTGDTTAEQQQDGDEQQLRQVNPELADRYRAAKEAVRKRTGYNITIHNGARTRAQQEADYRQGRTPYSGSDLNAPHPLGLALDLNWNGLPNNIKSVAQEELSRVGLRQGGRMSNGYDEHHHWALPGTVDEEGDVFTPASTYSGKSSAQPQGLVDSDGDVFTPISSGQGAPAPLPNGATIPSQSENTGTEVATPSQSQPNFQNSGQSLTQQNISPEELSAPTGEMANAQNFTEKTVSSQNVPKVQVKGNTPEEVLTNSITGVDKNTVSQLSQLSAATTDPQANIPFDYNNPGLLNAYDAFRKSSLLTSENGYELPDSPASRREFIRYLSEVQLQQQSGTDPSTSIASARTHLALAIIQELSQKTNRVINPKDLANNPEYGWVFDYLTDPKTNLSNDQVAFINKYSNDFSSHRLSRENELTQKGENLANPLTYADFARQYPQDPEAALAAFSDYSKSHAASLMIDVTEAKPGTVGQYTTDQALQRVAQSVKASPEAIQRTKKYLEENNITSKNYATGQEIKNVEDADNPVTIGGRTFVKYQVPLDITERLKDEQEKIAKGIGEEDKYVIPTPIGVVPVSEKTPDAVKLTSDEQLNLSRVSKAAAVEYVTAKQYQQSNAGMEGNFASRELRSYGGELGQTQSNAGTFFSMMATKAKRIFTGDDAQLSPEEENYYDSLQSRSQGIFNFGQSVIPAESKEEVKYPGQQVAPNGHPILRAALAGTLRAPQFAIGAIAPPALIYYNAARDFNKPVSEFVQSTLNDLTMLGAGHVLSSVTSPLISSYLESKGFSNLSKYVLGKVAGATEAGTVFAGTAAITPLLKKAAGGELTPEEEQSLTAAGITRHFMTGMAMTVLSSAEDLKDARELLRPNVKPIGDLYITTRPDGTPEYAANFKIGKTVEMLSLNPDHPFVQKNLDSAVQLDPDNFDRQLVLSRLANRYKEGTPQYTEAVKKADDYTQNVIKDAVNSGQYSIVNPEFANLDNEELQAKQKELADEETNLSQRPKKGTSRAQRENLKEQISANQQSQVEAEQEVTDREKLQQSKEKLPAPESRQPSEYDVPTFQEYVENEKGVRFNSLSEKEAADARNEYQKAYPDSLEAVTNDRAASIPEHSTVTRVEVTRGNGEKQNLLFVSKDAETSLSRAKDFINEVKSRNSDIDIKLPEDQSEVAGVLSQGQRALRQMMIVDPKVENRVAQILDYATRGVKNDSEVQGRMEGSKLEGQAVEQVPEQQRGSREKISPSGDVQENGREEELKIPSYHGTLKLSDTGEKVNFKYGGAPHILDIYDNEGKLSKTIDTTHPANSQHKVLAYDVQAERAAQNKQAASELQKVQNLDLPSQVKANNFGSRTSKLGKTTYGLAQNDNPVTISDGKVIYGNEKGLEIIRQALPDVQGKDRKEVTEAFTIDPKFQQEVSDNLDRMSKAGVEGAKAADAQVKNLIKNGRKGIPLVRTYGDEKSEKIVSVHQTPIDRAHEATHSNVFTHLGDAAKDVIKSKEIARTLTGEDGSVRALWNALPDSSYYKIPEKALNTPQGKALLFHEVLAFGATGDWKGLGVEPQLLNQAFKDVIDALMTEHPHSTVRKILDDALINGDKVYEQAIKRAAENAEPASELGENQSLKDIQNLQGQRTSSRAQADRQSDTVPESGQAGRSQVEQAASTNREAGSTGDRTANAGEAGQRGTERPGKLGLSRVENQRVVLNALADPKFEEWFGDSKVRDEDDKPLVVYHGTSKNFNQFDINEVGSTFGQDTRGFFFSDDPEFASRYANAETWNSSAQKGQQVIPAFVSIKNPYIVNIDFDPTYEWDNNHEKFQEEADKAGADGIIIKAQKFGSMYIPFEPEQIKSVFNRGAWGEQAGLARYHEENKDSDNDIAPVYYSKLERTLESPKFPEKLTTDQLKGMMKSAGISLDEMKWSGMDDFISDNAGKKITRQEVSNYVKQNNVKIKETELGQNNRLEFNYVEDSQESGDREWIANPEGLQSIRIIENEDDGTYSIYLSNTAGQMDRYSSGDFNTFEEAENRANELGTTGNTKWANSDYVLPGGENHKELVLAVPGIEPYTPSDTQHYGDIEGGRAIAWVRMNDRKDEEGNKLLFLEEVQSKRHQKGREKGYQQKDNPEETEKANQEYKKSRVSAIEAIKNNNNLGFDTSQEALINIIQNDDYANRWEINKEDIPALDKVREDYEKFYALANIKNNSKVPEAPFSKTWHELAMRRMIRYAAENGYDKLGWTTGEQQAKRYDLSKQLDSIRAEKLRNGQIGIIASDKNGRPVLNEAYAPEKLPDVIGKDLADKIVNEQKSQTKLYRGLDLQVGGEGMKGFYDRMLPSYVNKFGKKFGAKVETSNIGDTIKDSDYEFRVDDKGRWKVFSKDGDYYFGSYDTKQDFFNTLNTNSAEVHSVAITPEMKQSVLSEGVGLFRKQSNPDTSNLVPHSYERTPEQVNASSAVSADEAAETDEKDFTPDHIKELLDSGRGVVLSGVEQTEDGKTVDRNSQLEEELRTNGFKVLPATGMYQGTGESSFFVPVQDAGDFQRLRDIAARYNQKQVMEINRGSYSAPYTTGENSGAVENYGSKVDWGNSTNSDGYTIVHTPSGDASFSVTDLYSNERPARNETTLDRYTQSGNPFDLTNVPSTESQQYAYQQGTPVINFYMRPESGQPSTTESDFNNPNFQRSTVHGQFSLFDFNSDEGRKLLYDYGAPEAMRRIKEMGYDGFRNSNDMSGDYIRNRVSLFRSPEMESRLKVGLHDGASIDTPSQKDLQQGIQKANAVNSQIGLARKTNKISNDDFVGNGKSDLEEALQEAIKDIDDNALPKFGVRFAEVERLKRRVSKLRNDYLNFQNEIASSKIETKDYSPAHIENINFNLRDTEKDLNVAIFNKRLAEVELSKITHRDVANRKLKVVEKSEAERAEQSFGGNLVTGIGSTMMVEHEGKLKLVQFDPLADKLGYFRKSIKDWTPDDWESYGKDNGIEDAKRPDGSTPKLGGLSPLEKVDGQWIPGGVDGHFTYYDMLWMKANPLAAQALPEDTHAQLVKKLSRSVTPAPNDNLESFNRMMFGMLSPGTGLAPNEFAYSQIRARGDEDVRKLASYSDEIQERIEAGENPKTARLDIARKMKADFGIGSKEAGGLGLAVHADLSNLAEAAKKYLEDPSFFSKKSDESWTDLAARVSQELRGVGTKVAMFSTVWQDPTKASTGAIDIHMSRIFLRDLVGEDNFPEFEKRVVKAWNDEHPDNLFSVEKVDDIIREKTGQTWITNNYLNKLVSGKGKDISEGYKRALSVASAEAKKLGLSTFEAQWMLWDRQRNRVEPHETMFPGLYKLPKPSREEMMAARDAMSEAGYFGTKPGSLKATEPVSKLGYFLKRADDPEIAPFIEESKVKEPVFHGTDQDFNRFEKGDIGFHFGTDDAANQRLDNQRPFRQEVEPASQSLTPAHGENIKPFYIQLKNPLYMKDAGIWSNPFSVADDLYRDKIISKAKFDEINTKTLAIDSLDDEDEINQKNQLLMEDIKNLLKSLGHDGIIYKNEHEDRGSTSYIVFDSSQIKSAISPESPEKTALGLFRKQSNFNLEDRDDSKTKISNDTIREILALNRDQANKPPKERLSQTDIANHYGIDVTIVNQIISHNNETPFTKAAKSGEDVQNREAQARQMLLDGKQRDEINTTTGIHFRKIAQFARDLGLPSNRNDNLMREYNGKPNGKRVPMTLQTGVEAGKTLFADSTYEAATWDYFDKLASQPDSPIETWTPRVIEKPKYIDVTGKERSYTPDVYVKFKPNEANPNGKEVVFEVKPGKLINEPLNILKAESAIQHFGKQGIDYMILTGKDIGQDRIRAMADSWTPPEGFDPERETSIRKSMKRAAVGDISGRDADYMNPDLYQSLGLFRNSKKEETEASLRKEFNGIAWMDAALKNSKKGQLSPEDSQQIRQLIEQGENAQTDEEKNKIEMSLAKKVASLNPDSILKFLTTIRRAGMISGVKTIGKIMTSDTLFQGLEEASRLPAGFIDMTLHLATGKERSVQGVSPRAILYSTGQALKNGITAAAREFKGQGNETDLLRQSQSDYGTGYALARPFEIAAKYIFRTHGALYSFFSKYAEARSLYEAAWLESKNGGRSLQDALQNPTPEQTDAAVRAGLAAIFLNDNALNTKYQEFRGNRSEVVKFLLDYKLPFAKIGANVFEKVLDYSGIRSIYRAVESDPARALAKGNFSQAKADLASALNSAPERAEIIRAFSRGLIGWGLILAGYALQRKGLLTGFASSNPAVNKTEELQGSGAGHLKVGDHWLDISQLSPIATLLVSGASVARDANAETNKDYNALSNIRDIFFNALKEQPLVSGVSETLNPNTKANFGTQAADFLGLDSFIPNIIGEAAQTQDSFARDTSADSFADRIKKRIEAKLPNLGFNSGFNRQQLPVKTNVFGEPLQNPIGQDPFKTKQDRTTPLIKEMSETGFGLTPPKRLKIKGDDGQLMEETLDNYDIRKTTEGQAVRNLLQLSVASRYYPQGADTETRRKILSDVTGFAKKAVKENKLSDDEKNFDVDVITARENFRNQVETTHGKVLNLDSDEEKEFMSLPKKERDSIINSAFDKTLFNAEKDDSAKDADERFRDLISDPQSVIENALINRQERKMKEER